jgi:hypothetical protein
LGECYLGYRDGGFAAWALQFEYQASTQSVSRRYHHGSKKLQPGYANFMARDKRWFAVRHQEKG